MGLLVSKVAGCAVLKHLISLSAAPRGGEDEQQAKAAPRAAAREAGASAPRSRAWARQALGSAIGGRGCWSSLGL